MAWTGAMFAAARTSTYAATAATPAPVRSALLSPNIRAALPSICSTINDHNR